MFRKVTVEAVREHYGRKIAVLIVGMTARFTQDDGMEIGGVYWKRRELHPFDQSKIDATKVEKHRRGTVKWLQEQDWDAYKLERLDAVYAAATE
jgi:hypothetical protein